MKILISAALGLLLSVSAYATGSHPPPKPDPKPPVAHSTSDSKAVSGSVSGSKAVSGSTATGGNAVSGSTSGVGNIDAGSSATGGGGGSVQDNSEFNARAWSLVLPPPVFTPPMPRPELPMGCPAPTETQSAVAVGAGVIFSKADSLRDNSPCTAIKYSQLLWDRCQYQKADRVLAIGMKLFAKSAGEDWDAQADPNIPNYTLEECGILKQNMVAKAQPPMLLIPPAEPKKEVPPCAKGQKRNSKGVCYTPKPPCEEGKVLACIKKS